MKVKPTSSQHRLQIVQTSSKYLPKWLNVALGWLLVGLGRILGDPEGSWGGLLSILSEFGQKRWPTWFQLGSQMLGPKMEPTWLHNRSKNRSPRREHMGDENWSRRGPWKSLRRSKIVKILSVFILFFWRSSLWDDNLSQ